MYRYSDCPTDRNCVFCPGVVENEDHFLLVCPLYRFKKQIPDAEGCSVVTRHVTMERYKTLSTAVKVYFSCYEQKKTIYIDV